MTQDVEPKPGLLDAVGDEKDQLAYWQRRASVFADTCRFLSDSLSSVLKSSGAAESINSRHAMFKRLAEAFDDEGRSATKSSSLKVMVLELAIRAGHSLYEAIDKGIWCDEWPWKQGEKPGRDQLVYRDDFSLAPTDQLAEIAQNPDHFREGERYRLPQPHDLPDWYIIPDRIAWAFWITTLRVSRLKPNLYRIDPNRLYLLDAVAGGETAEPLQTSNIETVQPEVVATVNSQVPAMAVRQKGLTKQAKALAAMVDHPDWTDSQIAAAADCHPKSLYRWPKFKQARAMLKSGKDMLPKGTKDAESGEIEVRDANLKRDGRKRFRR